MSFDVSMLLSAIQRGESHAADALLPLVYNQLRAMARTKLAHESAGQTLQATALVHEAYLRLVDTPVAQDWHSRKYFFAAAAEAMRRILIENARRKEALKRGGDFDRLDVSLSGIAESSSAIDVLAIDEALTRLAAQDAQAAELVKLRYFTGLPLAEAAEMLEMSERSARRLWAYARSFLLEELSPHSLSPGGFEENPQFVAGFAAGLRMSLWNRTELSSENTLRSVMHEREVFITALEIDDELARRAYLDSACGGDPALRLRVERLLNREAEAGDFLEQPAADLCSEMAEDVVSEPNEPLPAGGELQTMIGQEDDTAQTILTNASQASDSQAGHSQPAAPLPSVATGPSSVFGTLFGRYRVERVLGTGGMGVVYLAEDLRLGRRVALKIPKFDADGRFKLIERFRREARTMASVVHRNLCPIFDVDEQAGTHYLTMAFIDGESLSAILKQGASFTERQIAELIRKLALALEKAHRAGVIHRDLKPANVMIDHDGEPILMDFGLAWMAHESDSRVTQSGAIVGTPAYMAPEQAEGEPEKVSAASDIYSLGAMFYELLTGQLIHSGSVTRVLFRLMHNEPTRPSEIRSEINPQLEAICWKAISRRPEDRFASAEEFAEVLARFLEGRPWEGEAPAETRTGERRVAESHGSAGPSSSRHRVGNSDRTEVLPPDTSAETIAYQSPGEPLALATGDLQTRPEASANGSRRTKSRKVLAGLLLIGVVGVVWAVVANWGKLPHREDIVEAPKAPDEKVKQPSEIGPATAIAPFGAKQARALQEAWAQHLGTPVETTNSVGMQMILIPPGEFLMGAPNNDPDAQAQEKPQHKVTLTKPFYIGATEVTVGQFRQFVEATKYITEAEHDGQGAFDISAKGRRPSVVWNKLGGAGLRDADDRPVRCVSWEDARQFCEWLGKAEGREYRLPTDAEWEFACRAGTQTRYWFGDQFDRTQLAGTDGSPLSPVAQFPANPFGLFDMHGNLNEICWDAGRTFTADPIRDPVGSLDASTPAVVRGGAVSSSPTRHRSSQRYINDRRTFPEREFATIMKGFRVSASVESAMPQTKVVDQARLPKLELAEQLPSVKNAAGLKLGDLDGDGDLDLFVATLKAPCVVLRNDGRGHFTDSGQQLGDNASFAVALGDLDGDGDLDAYVCNSDDQEDAIWLNDGHGTFQRSPQSFPLGRSNDVALADIDGDKDLDIVVSNFGGLVTIWNNDKSGRFTSQQTIERKGNTGVALGDLDRDGDADLVMTGIGGDNRVWFNDSQGHFTDSDQPIELAKSTSVALGDLDQDGHLDLFLSAHDGSRVWFNNGKGHFQASDQQLGDGFCEAVELLDLDADHDLDAVSIGSGFGIAKPGTVWRNDGKGRFAKGTTTLTAGRTQALAFGDLDGDGDADVIFGNLDEAAEVWLNPSNQSTIP